MPFLLSAPVLLALAAAAPAELSGSWAASDLRIDIDPAQTRARIDGGPWEPLQVMDVSGRMTVFTVGGEQFVGLFQNETLTVTRGLDRKSRVLVRRYLRSTLRD